MKKVLILSVAVLLGSALLISSCKNKDEDPEPDKTLVKENLYDKDWYNQGATVKHVFHTNGDYGASGSWRWLNNSDSMEIEAFNGAPKHVWYFEWTTNTEMSCRAGSKGEFALFKDHVW